MKRLYAVLAFGFGVSLFALASAAEALRSREWLVDGVKREALLHEPRGASEAAAAVVFVFHGHGGSMRQAARSIAIHERWPEALVVYPQGLPTPGRLTDPEGKRRGWQAGPGEQGDRDLAFFDAMWRSLQKDYRVDTRRVYATGHSNGGAFTYLLWAKRGDEFAAFGPSSAVAARTFGDLRPAPVIHIAGKSDPLVKFAWQKAMIETLRRNNRCDEGRATANGGTLYESKLGAPVMTYVHPGGHAYASEATALIVEFFQQHRREAERLDPDTAR